MLRAQTLGFQPLEIFLLLAAFNLVITLSSTPAGALSDRLGRRGLIIAGWAIYAGIYLGFAFASSAWHIWALLPWLWALLRGLPRRGQCLGGRSGSVRAPRDGLRLVQWGNRCRRIPGQPAGRPPLGLVRPARAVPGRRGACPGGRCRNARDRSADAALRHARCHAFPIPRRPITSGRMKTEVDLVIVSRDSSRPAGVLFGCPTIYAGQELLDAAPIWTDPRAHRVTRVGSDLLERGGYAGSHGNRA